MKLLEEKILREGRAIGSDTVKVDSFLNHQLDIKFYEEIGKEFSRVFADVQVDKIVTAEASGIAVAVVAARYFDYVPVVFAKKSKPSTIVSEYYEAECYSFTKKVTSTLVIDRNYLHKGENVLILDDFIATGFAGKALVSICEDAGCNIVGIGSVIDKKFQGGSYELAEIGYNVKSLAVISKIENGVPMFETEDY